MPSLVRRSDDATNTASPSASSTGTSQPSNATMIHLLIALVILVCFGLLLGGALFMVRRMRKAKKAEGTLPSYESATRNHNGLHVSTRNSTFYSEKHNLIENSSPMPQSPESVPEIRITFPEEEDKETGRRVSGKVVVVQVGEAGVGFVKPLEDDGLPTYEQEGRNNFASVDLDRYGGLKEVEAR